eukprot:6197737-Pleurochrysis_carterae.AAC.7
MHAPRPCRILCANATSVRIRRFAMPFDLMRVVSLSKCVTRGARGGRHMAHEGFSSARTMTMSEKREAGQC